MNKQQLLNQIIELKAEAIVLKERIKVAEDRLHLSQNTVTPRLNFMEELVALCSRNACSGVVDNFKVEKKYFTEIDGFRNPVHTYVHEIYIKTSKT